MMFSTAYTPDHVADLEPIVRQRAISLIEEIEARVTSCYVMDEFAFTFSVSIFLQFLGIGPERLSEFVGWVNKLLRDLSRRKTSSGMLDRYINPSQ